MLSCQECERYIPVLLDHALEIKESLDVQAHLQACPPCANRANVERRLRVFVQQHLNPPPLPDEMKHAMLQRAMQAESQRGWRAYLPATGRLRDFAMGMAAAALVVFALYGSLPGFSAESDIETFVREASLSYGTYTSQHMPLEMISADETALNKWLNTRMGYHVKMPCITDATTQLLGGRLCRLFDRKSAALVYQRQGVPIVLFAFRAEHMSLPAHQSGQPVQVRYSAGRPVAMWQHDGMVYSMVGDLHRDDLVHVASTVNYSR